MTVIFLVWLRRRRSFTPFVGFRAVRVEDSANVTKTKRAISSYSSSCNEPIICPHLEIYIFFLITRQWDSFLSPQMQNNTLDSSFPLLLPRFFNDKRALFDPTVKYEKEKKTIVALLLIVISCGHVGRFFSLSLFYILF